MDLEPERLQNLLAAANARNRLRQMAFGKEHPPAKLAFSAEWLRRLQSLRDDELSCAITSNFWGVPVSIEPLGAHAIVTYANKSCASVQLENSSDCPRHL